MSAPDESTAPSGQEAPTHHHKISPLWWVALTVVGLGLFFRYGIEFRRSAVDRGDELVKEVVGLTDRAKEARQLKDLSAAKQSLSQAIMILRDAEQFKSHPVYLSTLLDMGALLLSPRAAETGDSGDVAEGRKFLAEAWELAKGLDARTRWRIARDLGLGAVLAGDMAEAEKWYSIAIELVPEDSISKERLATLKNAKKWK